MLCFGVLKDLVGRERELLELADGASVATVVDAVRARAATDAGVWGSLAVAVNREYAGLGTVLHDGDEVALLPPVSGGCR